MAQTFKQRLAAARKHWKGARARAEESPSFIDIDDGRYKGLLTEAGPIGESQSSGRLQFPMGFKILEGEFKGQTTRTFHGLETEDSQMYLARDLAKIGYEVPDDLSELDELGKEMVNDKIVAVIQLRTKGDFQNLFIKKVLEGEEIEIEEEEAAPEEHESETAEGGAPFEVDQIVSFDWEGEQAQAKIVAISDDGETLTVEDDDGEYDVQAEDCQLVEEEGEEEVPEEPEEETEEEETEEESSEEGFEIGQMVEFEYEGEPARAEIISISEDGATLTVKDSDGECDVPVDEATLVEEEEVDFQVGQKVNFNWKGTEKMGTIRSFVSGGKSVNIKGGDNKLYRNVNVDDLAILGDDDTPF